MWKKPYKKGDRPVELNGKKHFCRKTQNQSLPDIKYDGEITGHKNLIKHCPTCDAMIAVDAQYSHDLRAHPKRL